MVRKKFTTVSLLLVLPSFTAGTQTAMDCDAMFQELETMITTNNKLSVAKKAELTSGRM